jgi:hypothetical protein
MSFNLAKYWEKEISIARTFGVIVMAARTPVPVRSASDHSGRGGRCVPAAGFRVTCVTHGTRGPVHFAAAITLRIRHRTELTAGQVRIPLFRPFLWYGV